MPKLMKILKMALIVLVIFIGISMLFGPKIAKYFQDRYYRETYRPEEINVASVKGFPPNFRIERIPWISYKKAYCQSAALQMIARKHGIKEGIGYFNFLMGFTYGGFYRVDMNIFSPYTDPVPGFIAAAPYLGLKMRCLTTDNRKTFLKAIRFYISRGYPVAVELDAAKLWEEEEIVPHVEVLIGYDEKGFEYFETGRKNRFKAWARGLRVDGRVLAEAVSSMTGTLRNPWKFSLIIFEKDKKKENMKEIWVRNGKSLVGNKVGVLASGSRAIRQFALKLKKTGKIEDVTMMENVVYIRLDNARFLRKYFSGDKDIKRAAGLFTEASNRYKKAMSMIKKGVEDKQKAAEISGLFLNGASLEKEIGEIFLNKGKE